MNLNQITVPSKDVKKSTIFYQELGLQLIVKVLPYYIRLACPDGNSTFSVHLAKILDKGNRIWIYFECNNLDAKVETLKNKGIYFDEDPTDQKWLWREARLKNLDGNQIILYYTGDNRLNPPWLL
jgi:catechol 2,3-dioxygenase-like lactoylglutathione lyase family enzyme